jgi:hypothetical protein
MLKINFEEFPNLGIWTVNRVIYLYRTFLVILTLLLVLATYGKKRAYSF